MLPEEIIDLLTKERQHVIANSHPAVTVMFSDFENFTDFFSNTAPVCFAFLCLLLCSRVCDNLSSLCVLAHPSLHLLAQIEAVRVLDMVFSIFDVFTNENGAYKVETVGCTYVAACGMSCHGRYCRSLAAWTLH
jgi:hypothetical protein